MTAISIDGLHVRYGELVALRGINLTIPKGQRIFIVGANGAGKSTLLRAIANAVPRDAGSIVVNGRATEGMRADAIVRQGYNMVPETREVFLALNVEENLLVGGHIHRDRALIRQNLDFVLSVLPALALRLKSPAGLLSGGQQQMLAIGRALMTHSDIIALDEPSLGLAPKIIDEIYETLINLQRRRQLTLLIAEQSYARAVALDSDIHIIRNGRIVLSGNARALDTAGELERAYFGF